MDTNKNFSERYQTLIVIFVFLLLQLPFLDSVRRIIVDENWYSNVAYNFSVGNGFINTNVGSFGGDICFLYPLIEGFVFSVFGTTLFVARSVSLAAGLISIMGILSILNLYKIKVSIKYLAVFLLLFSYNYFLIFRCARPEAWVFVFFVWVLYFNVKYWQEKNNKYIFWQGFFAGMSFLIHPWGLSFALMFGINCIMMAIVQKNIKILLLYIAGVTPFVLSIFLNSIVISNISIDTFVSRFSDRTTVSSGGFAFILKVKGSFISLFEKYNFKSGRIFILLFHAFISFYGLSFIKKNIDIFRISLLQISLVLITVLFYNGGGMEYMLHYIFLFTFLNIALIINEAGFKTILNKVILALALLFFINNAAGIFAIEKKEYGNPYSGVHKNVEQYIPKSSVVLAPIEMWFPCKECEFYNSNTLWDFSKYKNVKALLESDKLNYIIKADGVGVAQTEENLQAIDDYINAYGNLIYSLETKNYGNISIWEITKQ
jgi:hypothetical protein